MSNRRLSWLFGFGRTPSRRTPLSKSRRPRLETLEDRTAPSVSPGSVVGAGTTLKGQDSIQVNVATAITAGVAKFSGTLSFSDAKAHATFNATTITSMQINESTPAVGTTTTNGYFVITGLATLNDGTSATYSFTATGSLPFPATTGSTGGLSFQVSGPNGYVYSTPWSPWDAGETLAMTILPTTPSVYVSPSANPATAGQPVTYKVFISPSGGIGAPTGMVTLSEGTTVIGTATVAAAQTTGFTTASLGVGVHVLSAMYTGDSSFTSATGTLSEKINPPPVYLPRVSISASANPAMVGDSVKFTVYVSPNGGPLDKLTGSVTLSEGTTVIGAVDLANLQATFTTSSLAVGNHVLTATYGGNASFSSATGTLTETIAAPVIATPKVYINSSANPATVGDSVKFLVYVSPNGGSIANISGKVTLSDGTTVLGTADLVNAQATFTTSSLAIGDHVLTASYDGNSSFTAATGTFTETIAPAPVITPKVTIIPSANPATVGDTVTFRVYVGPTSTNSGPGGSPIALPTGKVTLTDGTTAIGSADLVNGVATFTSATLTIGDHALTASYAGNGGSFTPATGTLTEKIVPVPVFTPRVYVTASANPSVVGEKVTFKVAVSPNGGPLANLTGKVTLTDGTTVIGVADLSGGQASFVSSTLAVGVHTITASFAGNGSFAPATGSLTETIIARPTVTPKIILSSSANPAPVGQPVTLTAILSTSGFTTGSSATLTGNVTFSDGATVLGTVPILNGRAAFTTSAFTVGSHTITAAYAGNAASVSTTLTETITAIPTGSVSGQGSVLKGQDQLQLDVASAISAGALTFTGSLTFSDAKAGDVFTAKSITSVQVFETTAVNGPTTTNGYFVVTGTATLNDGTALYNFTATGSLPVPSNAGSTGGLSFQVTGPNGFKYFLPWTPWDAGETIAMTKN